MNSNAMSSPSETGPGIPALDDAPAARFGRYEVLDAVPGAAARRIFLARDPLTRRSVVLKAIRPQPAHPLREAVDRAALRHEAQAVGRLSHPGVVQIYDYGEDFFVMECARGESLATRLRRGETMPLGSAVGLVKALADALDHAHHRAVLHGDLGPACVMTPEDGAPNLIGFGRARILDEDPDGAALPLAPPWYTAPERLLGETWGPAAEVYALGALAYEVLTGRRPFAGDDPGLVRYRVVYDEPAPPSRFVASLPKVYDDVFAWALSKDPEHRPPTAAAFAQALESSCPREERPQSRPAPLFPRRALDDETFDLSHLLQEEAAQAEPRVERRREAESVLEVATDPAGAGVFLDGEHVGETPVALPDLGTGTHTLRLIRAGFTSVQSVVEAGRGRTRLMFTLQPLPRRRRASRPGSGTLAEVLRDAAPFSWPAGRRES
jgi:serine/threonine protein kinase